MRTPKRRAGFTLLELLIVIAIIGILASVLFPAMMKARELARNRAAETYAKNVFTASFGYTSENLHASLVLGDCSNGYVSGGYSIKNPGKISVEKCTVFDADADNIPEIVVETPAGVIINYPN